MDVVLSRSFVHSYTLLLLERFHLFSDYFTVLLRSTRSNFAFNTLVFFVILINQSFADISLVGAISHEGVNRRRIDVVYKLPSISF